MGTAGFLTDQSGNILTTGGGQPLLVSPATTNDDTQLFDFSVNLLQALLWQYNVAINLQTLLEEKSEWYFYNQTQFWNNWITDVFNLATANEFGLQVWSIILNQPIFLNSNPTPAGPSWGFGSSNKNFGNGGFGTSTGQTYQLPLETARILLRLRYFQLTSSGTVPEINRMLADVFQDYGDCYLVDNLDMSQRYVFEFPIPANLQLLFDNFDILPRPAGVKSSYFQAGIAYFGFGEYNANFSNGGFGAI